MVQTAAWPPGAEKLLDGCSHGQARLQEFLDV